MDDRLGDGGDGLWPRVGVLYHSPEYLVLADGPRDGGALRVHLLRGAALFRRGVAGRVRLRADLRMALLAQGRSPRRAGESADLWGDSARGVGRRGLNRDRRPRRGD